MRDGRELVPNVTHVVSAGQHLYFYYEVYEPAQPVKVLTSIAFFRGKVRVFETPVVQTTELAGSDKKTAVFQFDVPACVAQARPLHLPGQRRRRCGGELHVSAAAALRPPLVTTINAETAELAESTDHITIGSEASLIAPS